MKPLSQFMTGLAWASCWPATLQAAKENHPAALLFGALCAVLPDTLDDWCSRLLQKPDIHIVPPPENPSPHLISEALTEAVSQSHRTGKSLKIECYPIPIGPNQWIPYTVHFDCQARQISTRIDTEPPIIATEPMRIKFNTNHLNRISIHQESLSLLTKRMADGRIEIQVMPSQQQWSHSLFTALALGLLAAALCGGTTGIVAGGVYALHIFKDQGTFAGATLFWPFSRKRQPGFQWIKARQNRAMETTLLWMAFLLLARNITLSAAPTIGAPSVFQLLVFGGVIPLAILTCFRLNAGRAEHKAN